MKLFPLEKKILMNIQLGVTCVDMVDFYRPALLSNSVESLNFEGTFPLNKTPAIHVVHVVNVEFQL